jgi:hypothetical protein
MLYAAATPWQHAASLQISLGNDLQYDFRNRTPCFSSSPPPFNFAAASHTPIFNLFPPLRTQAFIKTLNQASLAYGKDSRWDLYLIVFERAQLHGLNHSVGP